jgi:HPt (histidine-containing phosphotransfer) domain-containing protein
VALYRAQILLEEDQHDQLERLARDSGRSMSELVREIMAEYFARSSEEESARRSLAAVDQLSGLRRVLESRHGRLPASLLNEMREQRDAELSP